MKRIVPTNQKTNSAVYVYLTLAGFIVVEIALLGLARLVIG